MVLEKLTSGKRSEVALLLFEYWKERGMPEYDQKWAENYLIDGHKTEIESDEFFTFIEGNTVIGVISLIKDVSNVAEIRDMVIKTEYRGKGYGKKMLSELISLAKEKKIRKLFSLSFPKLQKMYESLGFEKEGALKNHYADGEDLVIMSIFL